MSRPRGRPPKSITQTRLHDQDLPGNASLGDVKFDHIHIPHIPKPMEPTVTTNERAPMRPEMREDDPRERAARRAAALRNELADVPDGTDKFYVDPATIPEGWEYQWKRKTVLGKEDPSYDIALARKGWEPVPAARHKGYMPLGGDHNTIEMDGMILMEIPKEIADEQRNQEKRIARQQMRMKEDQLSQAPNSQFERNNKGDNLVKIKKSYEPMPVLPD